MVKKIRMIEDLPSDELDTKEFQVKVLEYMRAIDWKLWEMLKIEQARAAHEGLTGPENDDTVKHSVHVIAENKNFKQVMVDHDK